MKNYTPNVEIEDLFFEESSFVDGDNKWSATSLYDAVKVQNLKSFDIPLAAINLDGLPFSVDTIHSFIFQMNRVQNCDTSIPIILSDKGLILDGWHRICRAILDGDRKIQAYRLKKMPNPD